MKNIKRKYLIISCSILIIEITIALFVNDQFIRPIFGDYLASILVFYLLATFLKTDLNKIAILSLLISYTIEFLQYIQILELLYLDNIKILNILFGNSFSWTDMLAYTLGTLTVLLIHNYKKYKS
jgi:hypothetical protein